MLITEPGRQFQADYGAHYDEQRLSSEVARLFALDTTEREAGIIRLTAMGSPVIPALIAVILRPLGHAMTTWPEWQEMLPPQAIMARCDTARRGALIVLENLGRPAVHDLAALLQSQDAELRCLAAEALAHIQDPAAIAILGTLLNKQIAQAKRFRYRCSDDFKIAGSLCILLIGLLLGGLFSHAILAISVSMGLFLYGVLSSADTKTDLPVRKSAIFALARSSDPRYIGTLASCLSDPAPAVQQLAVYGLMQILPLTRVQHKKYIASDAMAVLLHVLDGEDTDLAVAVLNAMQEIGDTRALHRVAFLIDSPLHFKSVRSAAKTCLPYVKMRIREAHLAQELLRPATRQTVALKELLCPVQGEEPYDKLR